MIAVFISEKEALDYSNKIHEFLTENCKDYSASCWQVPVKAPKEEKYYVQIPQEYLSELYPGIKQKIAVSLSETAIKSTTEPDRIVSEVFSVSQDTLPLKSEDPLIELPVDKQL